MQSSLDFSVVARFVDKVTAPMRGVQGLTNESLSAFGNYASELKKIGQQRTAVRMLKQFKEQQEASNQQLSEARTKLNALRLARQADTEQIARTKTNLATLLEAKERGINVDAKAITELKKQAKGNANIARQIRKYEKQLDKATLSKRRATAEVVKRTGKLKKEGIETDNLTAAQNRLGDAYARTQKQANRLGEAQAKFKHQSQRSDKAIARAGHASLVAGSVGRAGKDVLRGLSNPATTAAAFSDAMIDVDKFVKGANLSTLAAQIRAVGKESPLGAQGIAKLVAAGGRLKMDQSEAMEFAKFAERFTVAADFDSVDAAANKITRIKASLKLSMGGLYELGDAINWFGDNTESNTQDITSIIGRSGSVAKNSGLNTAELTALAAAVGSVSTSAEIASTGYKNLLLTLSGGEQMANNKKDQLEDLGFDPADLAQQMQTNGLGAIHNVLSAINERDASERSGITEELFGRESIGAVGSLLGNIELLEQAMDNAANTELFKGSTATEYQRNLDKYSEKQKLMHSKFNEFKIQLGNHLLPVMNKLYSAGSYAIDKMSAFVDQHPQLAKWLVVGAGAMAAVVVAAAPVVVGIYALSAAIAFMGKSAASARVNALAAGAGGGAIGKAGKLGKLGKFAKGGGLITAGIGALSVGSILMDGNLSGKEKAAQTTHTTAGIGGALAGAKAGAMLGALLGPIGAAVGGLIGGIGGAALGNWAGKGAASVIRGDKNEQDPQQLAGELRAKARQSRSAPASTTIGGYEDNSTTKITVHAVEGMSVEQVAQITVDKLAEEKRKNHRERRRGGNNRGAMYDLVPT